MSDDHSDFDAEVYRVIENMRLEILGIAPLQPPMPYYLRRQLFLPVTLTKDKKDVSQEIGKLRGTDT